MKDYSTAMLGKEVPIYTGTAFQKIPFDDLVEIDGDFQLLGKTPNDTYHLDAYDPEHKINSHPKNLDKPHYLKLKVMHEPE
ncbi:MAG: hypothetical protein R3Y28_03945 [Candidatus Gastranaerophilales bacterium]